MDTLMNDDMSASDASEKIKDILFAKSAEKINTVKPDIASRPVSYTHLTLPTKA